MPKESVRVSPTGIAIIKLSRLVSLGLSGKKFREEAKPILEEFESTIRTGQEERIKRLEKQAEDLRTPKKILK